MQIQVVRGSPVLAAVIAAATFTAESSVRAADVAPVPVKAPVLTSVPPAWTFEVSPCLWAAGVTGSVDVGPGAPPVNVDAGFDEIFRHLQNTLSYV